MIDKNTNKKIKILIASSIFLTCGLLFFGSGIEKSQAGISRRLNYQGKLTNTSDVAVADGAYDMVFKIYNIGGGSSAALWTETWTSAALWNETSTVTITDGDGGDCPTGSKKIAYATGTNESTLAAGQSLWNTTQKEYAIIYSVNTGSNYICA